MTVENKSPAERPGPPLYFAGILFGTVLLFSFAILGAGLKSESSMARNLFIFAFTVTASAIFWIAEWLEKLHTGYAPYTGSTFLKALTLALIALSGGLVLGSYTTDQNTAVVPEGKSVTGSYANARDFMEPEEVADCLMSQEPGLLVVDLRREAEFASFHIRGATNIAPASLPSGLEPYKNRGMIVLYDAGPTPPSQARNLLIQYGFMNVYTLAGGLQAFEERCLKPVTLRDRPLTKVTTARINAWQAYFGSDNRMSEHTTTTPAQSDTK